MNILYNNHAQPWNVFFGLLYNQTIILFADSTRDVTLMHACLLLLPGNVLAGRGKEKKIHRKTLKEAQNSFIMVVKVRNLIITRSVCTSYLSATLICIKFWWNYVSIPPSQVRAICAKS